MNVIDLDIEREKTKQIESLSNAIIVFAKEFSKAGVHDNVKARAVQLLDRLTNLVERAIERKK